MTRWCALVFVGFIVLVLTSCGDSDAGGGWGDYQVAARVERVQHGLPGSQLTSVDWDASHATWLGVKLQGADLYYEVPQRVALDLSPGDCYVLGVDDRRWNGDKRALLEVVVAWERYDACADQPAVIRWPSVEPPASTLPEPWRN